MADDVLQLLTLALLLGALAWVFLRRRNAADLVANVPVTETVLSSGGRCTIEIERLVSDRDGHQITRVETVSFTIPPGSRVGTRLRSAG